MINSCFYCEEPFGGQRTGALCSARCLEAFNSDQCNKDSLIWGKHWLPEAYQNCDLDKLPDPKAANELYFNFNKSCYVYGPTGSGKTRSLSMALKTSCESYPDYPIESTIMLIRGKNFSEEVVERTRPNGKGGFYDWIMEWRQAEVLAIDELDKMSFSTRVVAELFELVEHRTSNNLTTLFTAQCQVEDLRKLIAGKNHKSEAAGIIRRIKENFLPIHFTKDSP